MNAFDREFWNVALKASIVIENDLKKLFTEVSPGKKEGISIAIARVREIKGSIETLRGNSLMKRLKEIEAGEE